MPRCIRQQAALRRRVVCAWLCRATRRSHTRSPRRLTAAPASAGPRSAPSAAERCEWAIGCLWPRLPLVRGLPVASAVQTCVLLRRAGVQHLREDRVASLSRRTAAQRRRSGRPDRRTCTCRQPQPAMPKPPSRRVVLNRTASVGVMRHHETAVLCQHDHWTRWFFMVGW